MKKITFILVLTVILQNLIIAQTLSKEQKIEDFDFLYKTLEDSYPYFSILERENNIKWLEKKAIYREKIENTENDIDFIKEISEVLKELHSGHADLLPTVRRHMYLDIYKSETEQRKKWVEVLEKGNDYWPKLLGIEDKPISPEEEVPYNENLLNCYILDTGNIAVISIKSFAQSQIKNDIVRVEKFLSQIDNYKKLIIDIQDNAGGASSYWSENLVPMLSKKSYKYKSYFAIRNSEYTKSYFSDIDWETEEFKDILKLPAIPKELNEKEFYYKSITETIKGKRKKKFKAQIYLLVNNKVYSSAEGLAVFCKSTKWATIVGETTAGDGAGGIDPIIEILPNSKIIFRFTGEMCLNPDGSSNEEMKTIPDIKIDGQNNQERLQNFAKTLDPKI